MLLIDHPLLSFDVLEHVLILRYAHIVGEHSGVLLIELVDARQPARRFIMVVETFKKFADVVQYEVILKYRHDVGLLVIDNVVHDFYVVKVLARHVLRQVVLHDVPDLVRHVDRAGLCRRPGQMMRRAQHTVLLLRQVSFTFIISGEELFGH